MHDREDAGLLQVDLFRADPDRGHELAQPPDIRRRKGLDQMGEAGEEGTFAPQERDEAAFCVREEGRVAGNRRGVEKDRDVHRRIRVAAQHPALELP